MYSQDQRDSLKTNVNSFDSNSLEITEWVKDKQLFDNQIKENYEDFKTDRSSPIFPLKANFKAKSKSLYFCDIPVLDSWLFKLDSSYTFYFIVEPGDHLVESISKKFGPHNVEGSIEINYISFPTTFYWDGDVNIILGKYHNILGDEKYDNCYRIIFGNMSFDRY